MEAIRYTANPIITPSDVSPSRDFLEVLGVFNPAAIEVHGKTILIIRVAEKIIARPGEIKLPLYCPERNAIQIISFTDDDDIDLRDPRMLYHNGTMYLTSISHLRFASSDDGKHFTVSDTQWILPETNSEELGVEDPRISTIDSRYYINYTAVSRSDIATALMVSSDLMTFERKGIIFPRFNRDVVLFEEKINGSYCALHRPFGKEILHPEIRLAYSPDLISWKDSGSVLRPRTGMWDSMKIGAGASPMKTESGWLLLYHGVNEREHYALGAALLDVHDPHIVLARSEEPMLSPMYEYEKTGFFGHTVFSNGAIMRRDGTIDVYYGACDMAVCLASVDSAVLLNSLK